MRDAPFGNIQARHDFEPGHQGVMDLPQPIRDGHVLQHAIDAIAQADIGGVRLNVDVRGVQAQRFEQDLIDEARHRSVHRFGVFHRLDVKHHLLRGSFKHLAIAQLLDRVGAQAKMLFDDGVDGAWGGDGKSQPFAQQQAQVALFGQAGQFAGGHRQQPVL